ncbi:hypothetical protein LJE72_17130 [Desulfosporosinus sp. SRJS8]|nr:hypothetical protein [Desulfosporosinus sp. SRJS8]
MRLTSTICGEEHHVTIPDHNPLRIGTFRSCFFKFIFS